jgi:predicted RNase H-like nuclease
VVAADPESVLLGVYAVRNNPLRHMKVVGIDACLGRWLAIVLQDGLFSDARLESDVAALVARWPEAVSIGIDIPVGLPKTPERDADRAARKFVGERRASVFATFPSCILEAPTYEVAKAMCVARGWPKPSIQSYGMRHRIFEVAPLARADERIFEVHPEVSFRELLGRAPSSKRTASGVSERYRALEAAGITLPDLPYPFDDVLDASIAAWSATRFAQGEAVPLPEGHLLRIGAIWR